MPRFSQEGRSFRVDTPLGADVLLLQRFNGQEGVSSLFHFTLELMSEDDSVDSAALLRQPMTVSFSESDRTIHGVVSRFVQSGQMEDLSFYRAEIVPWLWFLNLSWNYRIFQNKSVIEIATAVFDGLGYTDYEFRCSRTHNPREYCVQYRETDFNFVSRLFEEEGVFYFFEHSSDKHLLVVTDDNSALQPCPGVSTARMRSDPSAEGDDTVAGLELESAVHIGKVTLRDYDFTRPSLNLETSATGQDGEEVYGYPGGYLELSDGEQFAELILQESQSGSKVVRGNGSCRSFQSGYRFTLEEHFRADVNTEYLLLQVSHHGEAGDFRTWDSAPLQYANQFMAMPFATPFRPPRHTLKPRISGSQTAMVVGSSGEEIYTDEYGRVKVQFYWDRQGAKDQNSSCWVRVSYPWAGKGWGGIHIPRIGQEVIVEFLDGDPDRPIITGRVYNAEQPVPYTLPANKTQSGIKSRSSLSGGTDNFNEIRMEDKKGSELMYIHAEKDKQVVVENDNDEEIGHNETIAIEKDQTVDVGENQSITVGKNRTVSVSDSETITIDKDRTESVGGNETVTISKNRTHTVTKDELLDVGGGRTLNVAKDDTTTVSENRTTTVTKSDKLDVGKKLAIIAGDEISITVGSASITMKKNGEISINGKDIVVEGSGKITVKASSDLVLKGSKVGAN